MIATAARAREIQPEQIMTIYEMLTTYRIRCGSFPLRGWVAWCFVNGRMVEAEGRSPINAVENLRERIEALAVLFRPATQASLAKLDAMEAVK